MASPTLADEVAETFDITAYRPVMIEALTCYMLETMNVAQAARAMGDEAWANDVLAKACQCSALLNLFGD